MEGFTLGMKLNSTEMRRNILSIFKQSTLEEMVDGALWYPRALDRAKEMAREYNTNPQVAAGVIAALSPQQEWNQNLRMAEETLRTKRFIGHYKANTNKAKAIYRGEFPEMVLTSKYGYQKTLRFYQCISSAGKCERVCLDRHALAVVLGRPATDRERGRLKGKTYDLIAEAYRGVARKLGLTPGTLQAITWVTWKRLKKEETEFDISKFN